MNSVNLENYIWIYVYEDDWEQDGVLLETYSLRILDSLLNTLFGEGLINFGMVLLKVPSISVSQYLKVSEFFRLGSSLFHSMIVAGKKVFLKLRLVLNSEILAWFLICVAIVSFFFTFWIYIGNRIRKIGAITAVWPWIFLVKNYKLAHFLKR